MILCVRAGEGKQTLALTSLPIANFSLSGQVANVRNFRLWHQASLAFSDSLLYSRTFMAGSNAVCFVTFARDTHVGFGGICLFGSLQIFFACWWLTMARRLITRRNHGPYTLHLELFLFCFWVSGDRNLLFHTQMMNSIMPATLCVLQRYIHHHPCQHLDCKRSYGQNSSLQLLLFQIFLHNPLSPECS